MLPPQVAIRHRHLLQALQRRAEAGKAVGEQTRPLRQQLVLQRLRQADLEVVTMALQRRLLMEEHLRRRQLVVRGIQMMIRLVFLGQKDAWNYEYYNGLKKRTCLVS